MSITVALEPGYILESPGEFKKNTDATPALPF